MYAHRHYSQQQRASGGGALSRVFANVRAMFHGFIGR
jgi:hypothetical protein